MKRLGKYELHEQLGRGGYGTVYHATDTVLEVERAVKVLHPALAADPVFIERFQKEAKTAAKLDHPNIVRVYDLDEVGGRFFLVMEYMPGGSLKDQISREGHLSLEDALRITEQIASALQYANARDLVHRDIKPGNILFDQDSIAKLSDFGFSKALSGSSSATLSLTGGVIGTPAYMAPEIWKRGESVSPTTDVYSLACVFYEMITGEVLFEAESPPEVMTLHVLEGPQFPESLPDSVPEGIQALLEKALAQEPGDRYQIAGDFIEALIKLGESQESLNHQVDDNVSAMIVEEPGSQKIIAWRTLIITILSAVIVGLIVLGIIWFFNNDGPKPPTTALVAQVSHTVTPEPDLANGYVKVIENLNQINYQVGNQSPSKATSGDQIPAGEDVRLWTISGNAKLGLSDGSVIVVDQNTTIWLSSITSDTNPNVKTRVTIERGNVLVLRGPVRMETKSDEFRAWSVGAVMGVRHQPAEGIFRVECFGPTGSCDVQGSSGIYELNSGQSIGFEGDSSSNTEPADYESWTGLGGPDIPQPSPTPTATLTSTPTPTLTSTPTPTLLAKTEKPEKDRDEPAVKEKPPKPEPDDPGQPPYP